jgi:endonuclease-3 related protein
MKHTALLQEIFSRLLAAFGPQHWWPGETPFEVAVGAILTQSAAWTNVEKAIGNLKNAGVLTPPKMAALSQVELAGLVRPSGYFNMKAKKLQAFLSWLACRCGGDPDNMRAVPLRQLRSELLSVYGIGEETADSILLYAAEKPVFVIDAYTRRIIDRIGIRLPGRRYADYQSLFMRSLTADTAYFNEYHALLVAQGKNYCLKTRPACAKCVLADLCAGCASL